MKVYIITTESFPNGMAATERIHCYAYAIAQHSIDCEILVVNRLEDANSPLGNFKCQGELNGYAYRYMGKTTMLSKGRVKRTFNRVIDTFNLFCYLIRNLKRGDCIIFYSYNTVLLDIVKIVKRLKYAKLFIELCEHPSIQFKHFRGKNVEDTAIGLRQLLKNVSGVFVISHPLKDLVDNATCKQMNTCLLPIMFYEEQKKLAITKEPLGFRYIFHSGSLTQKKDGILSILEAFALSISKLPKDVKYLITGSLEKSPDYKKIVRLIEKYDLSDRVVFLGYLDKSDLRWYQENAYMAIIYKEDNLQNQFCFATKIGEYLRAGLLLLISKTGEQVYYLKDNESCIYHDNNVEHLANLIVTSFVNAKNRDIIALAGLKVAYDKFFCKNYHNHIINFLLN